MDVFGICANKKMESKLTLVRLHPWSLTAYGEGMKIMSIKDHVHSSINDFCEIIKAITNTSYVGNEEEQSAFLQFSENHYSCVFYILFKSIAVYGSICRSVLFSEKAYNICVW